MLRLTALMTLATCVVGRPNDCFFFCNEAPYSGPASQRLSAPYYPVASPLKTYHAAPLPVYPESSGLGYVGARLENLDAVPVQPRWGRVEQAQPALAEGLFLHSASSSSQSNSQGFLRYESPKYVVGKVVEPLVRYPAQRCSYNQLQSC